MREDKIKSKTSNKIKGKREYKRRDTIRKKNLVRLISANLGKTGKDVKNMYEMMLEAGYPETTARQQTEILKGIEPELKTIADQMEEERQAIMLEMKKKRKKAQYHQLVSGADIMTKNIQLLKGKATEIVKTYDWGKYKDTTAS